MRFNWLGIRESWPGLQRVIRHSRICLPTVPNSNPRLCLTPRPAGVFYHVVSVKYTGILAAARKRSYQWCVSLTPNNTKTIGRMTGHHYLRPIRRDLENSSYTTRIFEWGACETVLQLRALPLLLFFASRIPRISRFFHSVGLCVGGGKGGNVWGGQFMLRTTGVKVFNRFGARTQGLDVQVIAERAHRR